MLVSHQNMGEYQNECFSEKVEQALVVSFTTDETSGIIFKNDLFDSTQASLKLARRSTIEF